MTENKFKNTVRPSEPTESEHCKIAGLFDGWNETMIWSCLQGHMGTVAVDGENPPTAARISVGDFCFFAGKPDETLVKEAKPPILAPENRDWERLIERIWGGAVERHMRYSIKKEAGIFDQIMLKKYAESLPAGCEIKPIQGELYEVLGRDEWSRDLCSQFNDMEDYEKRGIGFVILAGGTPVAGASSYTIYTGGIEIEIDTRPDYRRQGLATACGARLILECLDRGLYPSWDAHDLRSVALAEKLGYHRDRAYLVYIKR